jgi:hypothetical protein
MSTESCPICGSKHKGQRYENSAYDADVIFRGKVSEEVKYQSSVGNGLWYCGPCPDMWHDSIPKCPLKDCERDGKHTHEFVGK